jgi:hypothetical protein
MRIEGEAADEIVEALARSRVQGEELYVPTNPFSVPPASGTSSDRRTNRNSTG